MLTNETFPDFTQALNLAREIGGKKYRGKDFGGGIVFQSYNTRVLSEQLNQLIEAKN